MLLGGNVGGRGACSGSEVGVKVGRAPIGFVSG